MSGSPHPQDGAQVWLVRHGETEWRRDGKHTSVTDVPLTEAGVEVARELHTKLAGPDFGLVLTSPRSRARHTAELAGFPDAEVDEDLVEWAYGDYEGVTTAEIRERVPGWTIWTDCPLESTIAIRRMETSPAPPIFSGGTSSQGSGSSSPWARGLVFAPRTSPCPAARPAPKRSLCTMRV